MKTVHAIGITSFDQCVVGALGRKPTTILQGWVVFNGRSRVLAEKAGATIHSVFNQALQGREADGSFKTARGKIYPHRLNQLLAEAMATHITDTYEGISVALELPQAFEPLVCNIF